MRRQKKQILLLSMIVTFFAVGYFIPRLIFAGSLEPPGPPTTGTMKTLDQIPPTWNQILPADDGPNNCNSSRFECVMGDEAVLDKETGLVWEKSPDTTARNWSSACDHCYSRGVFNRKGWRLPAIEELASLIYISASPPRLPPGHPFENVQNATYWSSTPYPETTSSSWYIYMSGTVGHGSNSSGRYVWCVRGGH